MTIGGGIAVAGVAFAMFGFLTILLCGWPGRWQ